MTFSMVLADASTVLTVLEHRMASALVLAGPCDTCGGDDFYSLDDDNCFERFLEQGGTESAYDPNLHCPHLRCNNCGADLDAVVISEHST